MGNDPGRFETQFTVYKQQQNVVFQYLILLSGVDKAKELSIGK